MLKFLLFVLGPPFGLFNQIYKAGCFVGYRCTGDALEFGFCELLLKITYDIELFPPAVKNFKARTQVVTADAAVIEAKRMPKSWAVALSIVIWRLGPFHDQK